MKAKLLFGVILSFIVVFSKPAKADSYYWTGNAGTTNWTTANNWFNTTSFGVSGYPGSSGTSDVAQVWFSNTTINLTSTITISSLQTPFYGTYNLTVTFTGNPTLNVTGISTAQPIFTSTGLTFSGAGTVNVGSSVGFQYLSGFAIGANSIVNFPSGTAVTFNNPPAFSNAGTLNLNNATFTISNTINNSGTININGASASISTSGATNNSGTITCTSGQFSSSSDLTNSGTINILSSGYFDLSGGPSIFTNTNTVNLSSSSTLRLSNNGGRLINSGSGVFTANASTVNLYGSGAYINNSATLKATGTTFSFNNGNYIQNTGTLTTQSACVFNMTTANSYISNTSTYNDHGSTYNLLASGSYFQNSGSTSVVKARGTTFNLGTNGSNSMNITNSGTFTADSTSYINLASYQDGLTNTGVFNAGTSGSPCKITLSAQACFVTNTGSSSQSAYFNLGSTSIISISGGYQPTVTNTSNAYSFFTLMSDALGSAAFDQILSNTNNTPAIAGTYNIQRFVSGGNLATNRGYRIFSSPTNITNPYSTSTTYTNYITLNTLKNSYTVYSSLSASSSYPGAFTAGPSGGTGFSYINPNNNSIIYFYNETRAVSNTSFNSGKHVGVTAIGASTVTLNGVGAVSMPVGNGYLMYYVGPNSRTDGTTGNPLDCYITNVGYVNQGDVTVALWYTPKNGSSNASTGQLSYSLTTLTGGAGYNMVGNPYPSTINIATVLGHNSNISSAYLLNKTNSPGQAYYAYTANGTSAPGIGYALSGEGFLVRTTSGGNSLTFKETDKVATQQLTGSNLLMSSPQGQALTIDGAGKSFKSTAAAFGPQTASVKELDAQGNPLTGLYVKIEKDSLTYDYCGVYFRSDWQSTYNENLDAAELDASSSSVLVSSLSSDGVNAAVKHFPDYKKGVSIKLYANGKADGLYNLKIEGIRNIDTSNYKITLLDHFKKDSLDIGRYKSYAFNILKSDAGTYGANRFELSIHQLPTSKYQLASFTAQKATDGVLLTWRAYNEGDNYFYTLEKQQANGTDYTSLYQIQSNGGTIYKYTDKTPNAGNNIYRLKQVDLFGNITYSALVSIYYDNSGNASMFTLYPNPTAETINVNVTYGKTSSAATGSYKLNIYDASGSLVSQKTADNSSFSQNVSEFKPGVYIVELKDNQGSSLGKTKFLKK